MSCGREVQAAISTRVLKKIGIRGSVRRHKLHRTISHADAYIANGADEIAEEQSCEEPRNKETIKRRISLHRVSKNAKYRSNSGSKSITVPRIFFWDFLVLLIAESNARKKSFHQ